MSNNYYTHGSFPSTGAQATSASMRSELDLITAGFDKLPTLTSNANKFIVVNSLGTLLEATNTLPAATVTDSTFTIQDNLDNTKTFQFQASGITAGTQRIYTMPDATTTLVGIDVTQTLTNKTLTSPTINDGTINNASVGATTASTGAFTTLSASSTVSGTGFSTYLASPPAIGGTAAAAGSFTTLSASSTVSGAGFSTYLASPPAIGGTTAAAGSFTTLSASSTVSGAGFSTYLASPPAIGGTTAAAGSFTTLSASGTVSGAGFSTYLASPPAIGGTAAAAGTFTTLTSTGNTTIGDAVTDTVTINSQFVNGTVLRSAQTATNTLALAAYDVDGVAYTNLITLTASNTPTLTLTSTGVGTINNMSIGATTASTGAFTTLSASGTTTLSGNQVISVTDNTNAALRITQLGTGNALLVEDETNPDSTPFVIDASGNVVIGYTSSITNGVVATAPVFQEHGLTNNSSSIGLTNWSSTAARTPSINFNRSSGNTVGTRGGITTAGTGIGAISFSGDDGTNWLEAARIEGLLDATGGTNDMPGRLVFSTTADGASSPTERMRINNAGNVGIGIAGSVDTTLYVGKNITGATTAYGLLNNGVIQSDVTTTAYMYRSRPQTAAAAFTLTNLHHYQASQNTIGATSAVTNQFGFNVESSLTGATNNYGFYGNLASASNTYNLYMNGTADNYLAGSLGVGTAPLTTTKLYVTNTVTDTANAEQGIYTILTANNASGSTIKIGNRSSVTTGASFAGTNILNAFRGDITYSLASAYTGSLQGFRTSIGNSGAGAVSAVYGFTSTAPSNTGGGSITNFYGFAQDDVTTATAVYGYLGSVTSGTGKYNLYMAGTASNYLGGNTIISVTDNTNAALRITQLGTGNALLVEDSTNPDSSPFVIDASGNVIQGYTALLSFTSPAGTLTPTLQVTASASSLSQGISSTTNVSSANGPNIVLGKSRGASASAPTIVSSGDISGNLIFNAYDGATYLPTAYIQSAVDGTPGTNDMPGRLVFSTTADGASTVTERMRIDASGNLLIGTTTSPAGSKELVLGGDYIEGVVAIGTVTTSSTISLANGTLQTATLTASTACTFTMPTAVAGKSFVLLLKQAAATGNGTATFTSVKWGTAGAPTITATAGKMDILTFVADGTNWYGSAAQGYTP